MICNGTTLRYMSFQIFIITAHVRRIFLKIRTISGSHHSKKFELCGQIRQVAQIFYWIIVKTTISTGSMPVSCPASSGYSWKPVSRDLKWPKQDYVRFGDVHSILLQKTCPETATVSQCLVFCLSNYL